MTIGITALHDGRARVRLFQDGEAVETTPREQRVLDLDCYTTDSGNVLLRLKPRPHAEKRCTDSALILAAAESRAEVVRVLLEVLQLDWFLLTLLIWSFLAGEIAPGFGARQPVHSTACGCAR